jgi:hypothetical protein
MSTDEIRRMISITLRSKDNECADAYSEQRRLRIQKVNDVKKGTIHLDGRTMSDMNLKPGDPLEIVVGKRIEKMNAQRSDGTGMTACLNEDDIRCLRLREGNRILVRPSRMD